MTASQMEQLLAENGVFVDSTHKRNGQFKVMLGYFYRHGNSSEKLADRVRTVPGVVVLDHGDHWANFSGGASLAKSSHFWVTFKEVD